MTFFKTCAVILALVLFAQSGCDFFCQHVEETRTASSDEAEPACHDTGEHQTPAQNHSSNHEIPKDCAHPQAVGDNPKFDSKVVKPTQVPVAIEFPSLEAHLSVNVFSVRLASVQPIKPIGPPTSPAVLRI